ncbi:hypothetical protein ACHAW6_002780 [Cyclotella cf. meneghiniana]
MTPDGSNVLKISSVLWTNVDLNYCHAHLKHKNNKYGCQRGKKKLGSVVVQYLMTHLYKNAFESSLSMPNPAATVFKEAMKLLSTARLGQVFLLVDGYSTLYWVANVLCEHKECYGATKYAMDRSQLYSGMTHHVEWVPMTNAYNKAYDPAEPDTSINCVYQYNQFDVFGVDEMAASEFDEHLSVGNMVSGDHGDFMDYTNGLIWLAYMHCCFMSVGDRSLHNTAFAELPDGALNESTGGAPGARN